MAGIGGMMLERYNPIPETWKAELERVPVQVRESAAAYLRDRWRIIMAARKRKALGKKSPAGDKALAEIGSLVRKL